MSGVEKMTKGRMSVVLAAISLNVVSIAAAAPQQPNRVTDQQARELVTRIDARTDTFRVGFDRAIDRSRMRGSRAAADIGRSINDLKQAAIRLRDRVNLRGSDTAAVEDMLRPATIIDTFVMGNQLGAPVERDWQALRRDLEELARAYGVAWTATGSQTMATAVPVQQVRLLVARTTRDTVQFRRTLDLALARSRINTSREEDDINLFVSELTEATNHLTDHVDRRQTVTNNIDDLMQHGASIDSFMKRHPLTTRAQSDWLIVRRDLDAVARAHNVAWDWNNPRYTAASPNTGGFDDRLSGTYQLDSSRGDDPRRAAQQATRTVPPGQRDRAYQRLLNRLEAPEVITIDRNGNRLSMATSRGPRVTFEADGRVQTEQTSAGANTTTRATFHGDQLVLATNASNGSDFTVTFEPMDAGANLRVTRRIVDDGRRQPVTVASFYRRSSEQPQWDVYPRAVGTASNNTSARGVVVPAGTRLVATLNEDLSTRTTNDRDQFSLTVSTPAQYRGAVIEGLVSGINASGRVSGRAEMALNLQTIAQRNSGASEFSGVIESIRTPSGDTIRVDNEGRVEPTDSQTEKTVQRGAIGAALGAIIGAIAGGGQGAGIGAVIGAGGGAGTVIAEGRDQLDLPRGTEVTITSGSADARAR
jgi:hypothetical protein